MYIALPLRSLYPALSIDKVGLPLHIDHPDVQLSPRLLLPGRGAAVQPVSVFILRCYTVAHTLASYSATLTTPSPAGYYVNKPRIPSLSLPPSLPPLLSSRCRPAWFTLNPHNNEV